MNAFEGAAACAGAGEIVRLDGAAGAQPLPLQGGEAVKSLVACRWAPRRHRRSVARLC